MALSGGVDSAVSAALLKSQGFQVAAVTMDLFFPGSSSAIDAAHDIAARLGIPHYVAGFRDVFEEHVIKYFCCEYEHGSTPNPCIVCNKCIKFGALLDFIQGIGAEMLATGHYARIDHTNGKYRLLKGADSFKDQSYFLYSLNQEVLSRTVFPVGQFTKAQVKNLAREYQLPVVTEDESNDICFLQGRDYREFLGLYIESKPGRIVDTEGRQLGTHAGLHNFTIGQRHGLNLGGPEKLYVTGLDINTNSVIAGPEIDLYKTRLKAGNVCWIHGGFPDEQTPVSARIRYRSPSVPVSITQARGHIEVGFFSPVKSVTPGQSIVFYSGDEVLGGGIILP